MSRATAALWKLGRELRYRALPIIGTRVVIETVGDVDHVLRQLVTPWIVRDPEWAGCDVTAGLAKYGMLDRWCSVDARELDPSMPGVQALRENGFSAGEPDPDPEIEAEVRAFAEDCVVDLAGGLGPCVLKLFLEDGLPMDMRFEHNRKRARAGKVFDLLPDYFPRGFVVADACITNASRIWLGKHFYL